MLKLKDDVVVTTCEDGFIYLNGNRVFSQTGVKTKDFFEIDLSKGGNVVKGTYKHNKGRLYHLDFTATNIDGEEYAVYTRVLDHRKFCRPLIEFKEKFELYIADPVVG